MLSGLLTLVALAAFAAGVAWVLSKRRQRDFDEAARLPLDDDEPNEASDNEGPRT